MNKEIVLVILLYIVSIASMARIYNFLSNKEKPKTKIPITTDRNLVLGYVNVVDMRRLTALTLDKNYILTPMFIQESDGNFLFNELSLDPKPANKRFYPKIRCNKCDMELRLTSDSRWVADSKVFADICPIDYGIHIVVMEE